MLNRWSILSLFFLSVAGFGCEEEQEIPLWETTYELAVPPGFPLPEIPENNELTAARVELGKKLFYDPVLSVDSTVACASCHLQAHAFSDTIAISPGIEGRLGFRNAPTLANVAYLGLVNKDGGVPKLDLQAIVPIEDENEMGHSILLAADRLARSEEYRQLSLRAYGREPDAFVITRALAAFQRTLISGNSRFDKYEFQNQPSALNDSELRGRELFFSERLACTECHNGFNFTDNSFRNNGLYEIYNDPGRRRVTIQEEDVGKFRVPTLRNVALSAPYMHDGSLVTLEVVIEHYNGGGSSHPNKSPLIKPLGLHDREKTDLINFLHSLTDSTFILNPEFRP